MALLETRDLTAFYGDFQALFGISLSLEKGETVAIIGANGAGQIDLPQDRRRASPERARRDPLRRRGHRRRAERSTSSRRGMILVPEGRRLFPSLTVEENLLVGAYRRRGKLDA